MRLGLTLLLLIVTAASAVAQEHGEVRRYFQDWLAACRADGYCSATAYQNPNPGGRVADYILRVGRAADAAQWEITFTPVVVMAAPTAPFEVAVDGEVQRFAGAAEIAAFGSINDFFLLGPGAQAVMERLAPGRRLTVAFTDTDGEPQRAGFSLSGLTAALLWIDEQQQRLGSARVAGAPPAGLAPADGGMTAAAGAGAELPPALLAYLGADPECSPFGDLANGGDIEIDPDFGPEQRLFILPCWSAAYNFGWKAFVETYGEIAQVALPEYGPESGWTATTHLVNYWYDPQTRELGSFHKGRGLGDCGSLGIWAWHEFGFRLKEFRSKDDCDGEPGDFPLVYQLTE